MLKTRTKHSPTYWNKPQLHSYDRSDYTVKGTAETIPRILQPYNIRVAHRPITTLQHLLTNVTDKERFARSSAPPTGLHPLDWQEPQHKTEHKRATRNDIIDLQTTLSTGTLHNV